jgi:hypothetical protein
MTTHTTAPQHCRFKSTMSLGLHRLDSTPHLRSGGPHGRLATKTRTRADNRSPHNLRRRVHAESSNTGGWLESLESSRSSQAVREPGQTRARRSHTASTDISPSSVSTSAPIAGSAPHSGRTTWRTNWSHVLQELALGAQGVLLKDSRVLCRQHGDLGKGSSRWMAYSALGGPL